MAQFQPSSFSGQFKSLELAEVQLTGKTLGKGSDATVQEVNWLGTLCAAKQLHENLLEDDSPSGARCLIENFEKECMTWSHLVHPCIVQFLGVHFLSDLHVPMLILEKMDTSLRNYLEAHNKEDFLLPDKVYVLRQVAQALSYLHSLSPPLVHHDLSPNNVLLNGISLQAKVTDFGMTRALDPSKMTRKSSVKGTQAFMAPEALVEPPKYDEKLDVFSYGNVIVTTVTHQWPNPGPYNRVKGGKLVAVSELQRRQQYIDQFSQEEGALLLPTVRSCLENRPNQRPTSIQLVNQMKQIESSHPQEPHSGKSAMIMVQLHTLLHRKESELQECRTQLREKDTELQQKDLYLKQKDDLLDQRDQLLRQQHGELEQNEIQKDTQLQQYLQEKDTKYQTQLQEKDDQLKQKDDQLKQKEKDSGLQYALLLQEKDDQLKQKDEDSGLQYALLLQENQQIQQERDHLKHERDQLKHERDQLRYELDQYRREWNQISTHQPKPLSPGPAPPLSTPTELPSASKQVAKKPPKHRRDMKCQKPLKCGGWCRSVATKADLIAISVGDLNGYWVEVYDKKSSELLRKIGRDQLRSDICDVAFLDEQIVVSDYDMGNLKLFTLKGELLYEIDRGSTTFKPLGVTVSPDGHIYVCDGANHCVCVFDAKGKSLFSCGSQGSGDECLHWPRDLCFASDGLLYITDGENSRICVCDKDGNFIRKFPTICEPTCIDATDCGHLIVSSKSSDKVMVYTTGGELVDVFGGCGSGSGQFNYPSGVSVDRDGLVYICDSINHRIQIFDFHLYYAL